MRRGLANDLEHRRGLVLGLTLAEVLLLLLFLLLLALGSQIVGLKSQSEKTATERDAIKEAFTIAGGNAGGVKLEAAIAAAVELKKKNEALANQNASLVSQLEERSKLSERLRIILGKASKIDPNDPPAVLERGLALIESSSLQTASTAPTASDPSKPEAVEKDDGGKGKHNWPPIIILSEADKYTFASGSADLSPDFKSALSGSVIDRLLRIIKEYDVNVVEVIGHTDEQSLLPRYSNLDKTLAPFVAGTTGDRLIPSDNAGLGLARAVSVVKVLASDERLKGLSILPFSGAQMVDLGDKISTANSHVAAEKRRRIEIRVRRSSATVEADYPQAWVPITTSAFDVANLTGEAAVIDGDTFDLGQTRIRLWGVAAIEGGQFCFVQGISWDCGAQARQALKTHVQGRKVECVAQYKDRSGATVAKCSIGGDDIGAWLVRSGFALDFQRYSNGAYATQQQDAQLRKVGVWQGDFQMPWDWRKANIR